MKKALLIINVQKSAVTRPDLIKKIETLQNDYNIFLPLSSRMKALPF